MPENSAIGLSLVLLHDWFYYVALTWQEALNRVDLLMLLRRQHSLVPAHLREPVARGWEEGFSNQPLRRFTD
jgi:hypothetical protein